MRIKPQFDLTGKVAIITGASKGIGESIARGLAEHGAKVVISSRKQEAVDAVAAQFKSDGLEAIGKACHVGHSEQIDELIAFTNEQYGRIDIIVNNAATNPIFAPLEQTTGVVFDKIMNINVKAPLEICQKALPIMEKGGGGSIINISSVEGLKPTFGLGAYSVSKAAFIMLTQNMAKEWAKYGIRANAICPGLVKTKFSQALWDNEGMLKQYEQHIPAGRMAAPDEMAGFAVFLASAASAYTTGGVFTADGGYMLA